MSEDELEELLRKYPTLYHMAEAGSWPLIEKHGLLSTAALLDRCTHLSREERQEIQGSIRKKCYELQVPGIGRVIIRDQKPMNEKGLLACLTDRTTPEEWCKFLNKKVFFWLNEDRLRKLMSAYDSKNHDVLQIDAKKFVRDWREKIFLSPLNSGSTIRNHLRSKSSFQPILTYPYADRKRRGLERVVELTVDYAIPDIVKYIKRVERRYSNGLVEVLFRT